MKIISLVGARPQFIKEAVLGGAVREHGAWEHIVVHSGQHYDQNMSQIFFDELGMTAPKYNMNIGSGSHAKMTAAALSAFEEILLNEKPDKVIVYGDTNTTLAGALAAVKLKIPVAHVEAGLRQEPRDIPEEINRVLTDRISQWLFCCSELGAQNLVKEGLLTSNVHITGDIMYDLFLKMRGKFDTSMLEKFDIKNGEYMLVTLHRDFNVDNEQNLRNILREISENAKFTGLRVVFPVHPRTRARIENLRIEEMISDWILTEPAGYLELMGLLENCAYVVTDSGGFQKEAWFANKRAAVIMPDTSWRELTDCGWNILIPSGDKNFAEKLNKITAPVKCPQGIYGNGDTAEKIISILKG